jgi:hypothetical protein
MSSKHSETASPAYAREGRRAGSRSGHHPSISLAISKKLAIWIAQMTAEGTNNGEWRLTWWSCDVTGELASKAFMRWGREKQNAVSKYPVAVSNQIQRALHETNAKRASRCLRLIP